MSVLMNRLLDNAVCRKAPASSGLSKQEVTYKQTRCSRGCSTNTFVINSLIKSLSHSLSDPLWEKKLYILFSSSFFLDRVVKLVSGGSVINGTTPSRFFMISMPSARR